MLSGRSGLDPNIEIPAWTTLLALIAIVCWPREIAMRPRHWWSSVAVGAIVFILWIAPDRLWPHYRESAFLAFANFSTRSTLTVGAEHANSWIRTWRFARATLVVPIVEELFWRAWLMRWLIHTEFRGVRLGTYSALSFWMTAALFASEHGAFWDVGVMAGIIYNWWMLRTKSVADCVLMHAVTNALLSTYVLAAHQWQYWG